VVEAHEYKSSNRPIAEGVLECTQAVQLSPCGFGQLTSEEVAGFTTAFDTRTCSGDLVIHMCPLSAGFGGVRVYPLRSAGFG
jgi:hypothetical protein